MISKTAFVVFASLATSALAEPIEVSCSWDAPSSNQTEPTGELAKFYGKPNESAYFRFDVKTRSVAHNDAHDTQSMVLPNLSFSSTRESVTITAYPSPIMLKGRNSILEIFIDRYTLASIMILATANPGNKGRYPQWSRPGQCRLRQF